MFLRAFRGLVVGLALSALNFIGALVTLAALGGLSGWSRVQFLGLFAVLELARGLAFFVCPNIWRLPVAAARLEKRTEVQLAASTVLAPHWGAAANCLAGLIFGMVALEKTGADAATPLLAVEVLLATAIYVSTSLLGARWGVARPDLDVFFIVLRRPRRDDHEFEGFSTAALVVQFFLSIGTFPAVKLLPSRILYRPQFAPSLSLLGWTAILAAATVLAAVLAWSGRISWRAPRAQQREAEEFA